MAQSQAKGDYKVWSNVNQTPDINKYAVEEREADMSSSDEENR